MIRPALSQCTIRLKVSRDNEFFLDPLCEDALSKAVVNQPPLNLTGIPIPTSARWCD
jgi:hypothetical protein